MILDDRLLKQQWVQELPNDDFRMLMYLFASASKCGIVELNMRMLNFVANTGRVYSKKDILDRFGNLLCLIPNHEDTAIFPDWINRNWTKGRSVSGSASPLFRALENELAAFGLDIESVSSLANGGVSERKGRSEPQELGLQLPEQGNDDGISVDEMFTDFWNKYPSSCPRKVDKKRCRDKFARILAKAKDKDVEFRNIIEGLDKWIASDTWRRNDGAYIMAPLRWLNCENWNDKPKEGGSDEGNRGFAQRSAANYRSADVSGAF